MANPLGTGAPRRIATRRGLCGLSRGGRFVTLPWAGGPPPRFDGCTLGIDEPPGATLEPGPGEGCVMPAGARRRLEASRLVPLTPGPAGEHRPLA
ncbi:MAG TPA: hypothetical protein VLA56_12150 [Pseudomonadales bacterium]|nr:hypothetical protein [Pseudomonadales bacterium]